MPQLSFSTKKVERLAETSTSCLVLPLYDNENLSEDARRVDAAVGGSIARAIDLGEFSATPGKTLCLMGNERIHRILLVGCGERADMPVSRRRKVTEGIGRGLAASSAGDALLYCNELALEAEAAQSFIEDVTSQIQAACYTYKETLSKPKDPPKLAKVAIAADKLASSGQIRGAIAMGKALGAGINLARELGNLPANICTPTYLASQARSLGRQHGKLSVSVLSEKKMRELGMGSLLSVGHGSDQPSQLIVMQYKGGKAKEAPYALVGKGITFDTGGISLKPGPKMDEMKFDMGGAASVFGTIRSVVEMDLPINVIGVVAAAENMPSGRATKPGDVVKSLSGKTIEILNTDAEGRLVLCDALTYVGRYKPREVVDIATLTGAIIVSLGHEACGIFANDDDLADALLAAGQRSHDRGWRMPIWDDYQKQLDSRFADMQNIGAGSAGSVTAACFLARFTENYKWAHLDVAGTAFRSAPKGATGRPVPMLVEYLRERARG
jgi:leucyl aminopeptidase